MSWHYLQGQGGILGGKLLGWRTVCAVDLIHMPEESCSHASLTDVLTDFQSGTTCEPLMEVDGVEQSISSAAAFHVRTLAQQEKSRNYRNKVRFVVAHGTHYR